MKDSRGSHSANNAAARTPLPGNLCASEPFPGTPGIMGCAVVILAVMGRL